MHPALVLVLCCGLALLFQCAPSPFLTAEADATLLYCDSTIRTAGEYNVSCNTSSFAVYVFGCAENGADGSSYPGVLSINLLTSPGAPTQLVISDYKDYFPQAVGGALANCVVRITYLAPVLSALGHPGNVFVALTSHLQELRVTLLSTLYLGESFVWVRGVGAPNASIGLLSVVAGQQSSITCAGSNTFEPTCRVAFGAALVKLDRSPPIGRLSVMLNGTNVTGAMWPGSSGRNVSSFALVMIDNLFAANAFPTLTSHYVVLQDVVGAIVGSRLLAQLNSDPVSWYVSASYPQFNGTIVVINELQAGDVFGRNAPRLVS
jgi:hypothetical protein